MKIKFIALYGCVLLPLLAADPEAFVIWPKGVPPGGPKEKLSFGDHTLSISHREQNGVPEVHEKLADVLVVQSGEATLVLGGEVVGPHSTGPGEIRGTSIRNGVSRKVAAGDVIHINPGIPHQFFIEPGKQITYVVVHAGRVPATQK